MNETHILAAVRDTGEFLLAQGLEYALIGGLAVAVRGEPRATLDVDAIINCDIQRALLLLEELDTTPFKPFFDGVEEVVRTGLLLPLEHKPTRIRIDLAIGMSGFDQSVIQNATMAKLGGYESFVASAEYLVVMKQLAARPRDLDDIEGILIRQRSNFDWELTLRLALELGQVVEDDLVTPLEKAREKFFR